MHAVGERLARTQITSRGLLYGFAPIALVILLILGGNALHRGKIYPGVHALGVSLAGLNETEAQAKLTASAAQFGQTQAAFGANGQTVQASLADLGVSYDVDSTVNDGMKVGRGFLGIGGALRAFHLANGEIDLPVKVTINQAAFETKLTALLAAAGVAPQNATITIQGTSVSVAPERSGALPDFAKVEKQLTSALKKHQSPALSLELHPVEPSLRAADLATAATTVQQFLQTPLTFTYGDRSWNVGAATVGQNVSVNPVAGGSPVPVLSANFIASLVGQFSSAIDSKPIDAATGSGGEYGRLIDSSTGKTVDANALTAQLQTVLQNGSHDITIPVTETPPSVTSDSYLASLGISTLISTGTSDFSGSAPGRRTNIETATNLINGLLIPPRKIWSYNKGIGEINANKNFVPAGATENGILGTAVGGGVCQVSTTVFRAALFAGMPIQEWWPHAFREIYYEQGGWSPGFDASIQQPDDDWLGGTDFQFVNATDHWMLIRASISSASVLTVSLYGAPTGLTVKFDDPVITDETPVTDPPTDEVDSTLPAGTIELLQPDRAGMTVHIVRHVYDSTGKEILTFPMDSVYEPQPAIYRVSPDMAGAAAADASSGG
jgi:vancomycin resistance protein YoaR